MCGQAVVTSPYDVVVIIAKSIPRQSTFFITYVMLLGMLWRRPLWSCH